MNSHFLLLGGLILFLAFCAWLTWPGHKPAPGQMRWKFALKWGWFMLTLICIILLMLLFVMHLIQYPYDATY
ncbi:hypothetical protein [Hymenobacter segetis]|uniref:Uncharacterized protein n=1 Tax=Hymenobacter segetis TaxID=2025509 RepID=A0ABU9LRC4_9BACT